ncbi:MAG: ABC transporter ATP-binding protein [Patescibacteria group bacterium]|nr:ABC transporter ATP-binding protein [Patescibacteria group bacterium]
MIECKDIIKIYKNGDVETVALKNISFEIKEGEFVAIMGASGSGKSTLMHIIGALDNPTSGLYKLDGKDVSKLSDDDLADIRKNKIGFVFQAFNLLPRATVLRNVKLPLIYADISDSRRNELARESLTKAGLPEDRWDHLSNQLSGGQMQRVAIARALVNNPSIILADEPTGNLDSKTGEVVLGTFQELNQKNNHTIVLITHELYVAEHADRIIHLQDGVILSDKKNSQKRLVNHHHETA